LSVTLLNDKDCERDIAIKPFELRNDFGVYTDQAKISIEAHTNLGVGCIAGHAAGFPAAR